MQKSLPPNLLAGRRSHSFGLIAFATAIFGAVSSQAAIIVEYEFTGNTLDPTTSAVGVTTSPLATAGVSSGGGSGFISDGAVTPSGNVQYSQTGFADGTSYFAVTVVVQAGYTLSLTNFEFYQRLGSTAAGRVYDLQYRVGSSGGFTTLVDDATANTTTYTQRAAPLGTVSELQNLTSTSVEFRIVPLIDNDATTFRIDDLKLEGTIIPEPSAAWLGLLGVGAFMAKRRR